LLSAPLPQGWEDLLAKRVRLYRIMPSDLRRQLHGLMNLFLHEKRFVGCLGLEVTDEMRAIITAQACALLLNRDTGCYPGFQTIYIYPGSYIAREKRSEGLLEIIETDVRAGEAWRRGPVVLSWEDICEDAEAPGAGFNVVLHEFAHKLDEENDSHDGLPVLNEPGQYETWAKVMSEEFAALCARVDRGEPGVVDDYGAESPSEFFAVVTEAFFERSVELHRRHPALYEEFRKYYRVDPVHWQHGSLNATADKDALK
jgi:hypothetical protein